MAKISITHPSSTGTHLYGSQRSHSSFVAIQIQLDNAGDHLLDKSDGDDTGFKGAHASTIKRVERHYKERPGRKPEYTGYSLVDAPELEEGRRGGPVIEIAMSFEQFAEMLCSTGHLIDCTVQRFRGGIGTPGEWYEEEVTPPPPIYDRAQRRMEKAHAAALKEIDEGLAEIETWKATGKVKDAARHRLKMARQHLIQNAGYAVQQAGEELASVAEGALSIITDKVMGLEAAGKLPAGSVAALKGEGLSGLLPGAIDAQEGTSDV